MSSYSRDEYVKINDEIRKSVRVEEVYEYNTMSLENGDLNYDVEDIDCMGLVYIEYLDNKYYREDEWVYEVLKNANVKIPVSVSAEQNIPHKTINELLDLSYKKEKLIDIIRCYI